MTTLDVNLPLESPPAEMRAVRQFYDMPTQRPRPEWIRGTCPICGGCALPAAGAVRSDIGGAKLTDEIYVCRCRCGRAFASAYTTTPLCRACCVKFAERGGIFEKQVRRLGRYNWTLALAIIGVGVMALAYLLSMGQAEIQGWDQ